MTEGLKSTEGGTCLPRAWPSQAGRRPCPSLFKVPKEGLEPSCLATHAPETCVSTNSTTSVKKHNRRLYFVLVPRTGLEPAHRLRHYHLTVACLPISPPGLEKQPSLAEAFESKPFFRWATKVKTFVNFTN